MQKDCFQGHQHTVNAAADSLGGGTASACRPWGTNTTSIVTDGTNGTPRIGNETRPVNFTVQLWKRIA